MYQIFTLRKTSEKYMEKKEEIFIAFIDRDKAYDRVNRSDMWRVLQLYEVHVRGFYGNSELEKKNVNCLLFY